MKCKREIEADSERLRALHEQVLAQLREQANMWAEWWDDLNSGAALNEMPIYYLIRSGERADLTP